MAVLLNSVRLLDPKPQNIRAFLNDPIVEDTNGINRGTSSVPFASWSVFDRARFHQAWLRINPLPGFDNAELAGQGAAWLFIVIAVTAAVWSARPRRNQEAVELERQKTVGAIAGLATHANQVEDRASTWHVSA